MSERLGVRHWRDRADVRRRCKDRDAKRNMLAIAADCDKLAEHLLSQAGNKIMPITAAVRRPGRPMPATSTIHRWEHAHEQFRRQHARAKRLAAEMIAEHRTRALACTHATAAVDRFDALRWLASRLDPTRRGNEVRVIATGGYRSSGSV